MKVGKYLGEQHQKKEASNFDPCDCSEARSRQASKVAGCNNLFECEMTAVMAQQDTDRSAAARCLRRFDASTQVPEELGGGP